MRRRAGVLGLVALLAFAIAWWHHGGSNDTPVAQHPSRAPQAHTEAPRTPARTATLGGHVTRKRDQAPVVDASIAIELAGETALAVATVVVTTDRDGAWTAPVVPGRYEVTADAPGFMPAARRRIDVRDATTIDLALTDGGVEVRGTVSDIGGGPIAGARVSGQVDDDAVTVLTHSDGTYRMSLVAGVASMTVRHDDYCDKSATPIIADPAVVQDFWLVPGSTIRGIVVARDSNRPVAGAIVRPGWTRSGYSEAAETDEAGKFVLRQVPAGDLALFANATGYASSVPGDVNVGIGEAVETRLVVDRGYAIRGRIVREGHPDTGVAGVSIDAHTESPMPDNDTRANTGPDGRFEIVGLAPAVYQLTATGDGVFTEKRGKVAVEHDVDGVVIAMASGVTLRGRVVPPAKASLSVAADNDRHRTVDASEVADDGTFTIYNVPSGEVTIEAWATRQRGSTTVHVGTTDQSGLTVSLSPTATVVIRGKVVDDTGASVASAIVVGDTGSTMSAADGTFSVEARRGKDHLWATASPRLDRSAAERAIELDVQGDIHDVVLKVRNPRETISGRVLGPGDAPAPDVWVSVAGESGSLTASDGTFTLSSLPKGNYEVRADAARGDAFASRTDVKTGDRITLTLQPRPALHGRVTLDGVPVTSFDVHCDGGVFFDRHVTSADGTFTVPHLKTGRTYCEAATANADGRADTTSAASLDIQLHHLVSISGTVVDAFTRHPVTNVAATPGSAYAHRLVEGDEPVPVDSNGRFTLERIRTGEEIQISIVERYGYRSLGRTRLVPTAASSMDLGAIPVLPLPAHPGGLGIVAPSTTITALSGPAEHSELRVGDKLVAVDGVPMATLDAHVWLQFFRNGANAGESYAITVARGVTVNVTAQ